MTAETIGSHARLRGFEGMPGAWSPPGQLCGGQEESLFVAAMDQELTSLILPRCSAMVGFMRHSPTSVVGRADTLDLPKSLPSESPYVGFQRHAPPTPQLRFSKDGDLANIPALTPLPPQALMHWTTQVPEDVWAVLLSYIADVRSIAAFAPLAQGILELLRNPQVWAGRPVHLGIVPQPTSKLAPWLLAWEGVSRLVVPGPPEVVEEICSLAPEVNVEVAWRFDQDFKGEGVEVLRKGRVSHRVKEEHLVVFGDAPLRAVDGNAPYLEIRIDERVESGLSLNDFGLGFTECNPADIEEICSVADEVPDSWVVDFTRCSVILSVNNEQMAKGFSVSAIDLCEGTRVGLRIVPDALEIFIDGILRERLCPEEDVMPPTHSAIYPVFDLYGNTVQISVTDMEAPSN